MESWKNQFISEIKSYTKEIVHQIKNMDETLNTIISLELSVPSVMILC